MRTGDEICIHSPIIDKEDLLDYLWWVGYGSPENAQTFLKYFEDENVVAEIEEAMKQIAEDYIFAAIDKLFLGKEKEVC